MKRIHLITRSIATITMMGSMLWGIGGCATLSGKPTVRIEPSQPVVLLSPKRDVAITVYGGLTDLNRSAHRQIWWQKLIYGPDLLRNSPFQNPQGMALAGSSLYVCDQGWPYVFRVDLKSGEVAVVKSAADGIVCPVDVALHSDGRMFVADAALGCVLAFDGDGVEQLYPPEVESTAASTTVVNQESTFAATALLIQDEMLYVADRQGHRIARYNLATQTWEQPIVGGEKYRLGVPAGLAVVDNTALLVADALSGHLYRVSTNSSGDSDDIEVIATRGRDRGTFIRPTQICVTPSGFIFVADLAKQAVTVLDALGRYVMDIDATEQWPGIFLPGGVECLSRAPDLVTHARSATDDEDDSDWVIVSDTLGPNSLILLSIRTMSPGAD